MDKFAIISVFDKKEVETLARAIEKTGRKIISTGQTAVYLQSHGISVTSVNDFTGFPEILSGRVKSLHPKIYAGILALQKEEHINELAKLNIPFIDFVVVNFYPFAQMRKESLSIQELVEYMDVGGPCMLRAAVKSFEKVTVVTDPLDYSQLIQQLEKNNEVEKTIRQNLAVKAMESLVCYDSTILEELSTRFETSLRRKVHILQEIKSLRYGENPHQEAFVLQNKSILEDDFSQMKILSLGKEMSYNNYLDLQAGYKVMQEMGNDVPICCVIKHGIPCGVSTGKTIIEALKRAWQADSISAFGGIVLSNREFSLADVEFFEEKFVEMIVAPAFSSTVLSALQNQGGSRRIVVLKFDKTNINLKQHRELGSLLLQQDINQGVIKDFQVVSGDSVLCDRKKDLFKFSVKVSKHLLSNALCIAWEYEPSQFMTVGIGCGQPNRIDALILLAVPRAKSLLQKITGNEEALKDCVIASDGFFPFTDSIEQIHRAGLQFVIQPGGSIQDSAVIKKAQELGVSMVFSGMRHFMH